mmetsp:Transcript_114888/g.336074  ORF Transcript_114888/g.336074 Transcript_114888/m.336074 type:complete len:978 (+) Transcript_114888:80-3013(+)
MEPAEAFPPSPGFASEADPCPELRPLWREDVCLEVLDRIKDLQQAHARIEDHLKELSAGQRRLFTATAAAPDPAVAMWEPGCAVATPAKRATVRRSVVTSRPGSLHRSLSPAQGPESPSAMCPSESMDPLAMELEKVSKRLSVSLAHPERHSIDTANEARGVMPDEVSVCGSNHSVEADTRQKSLPSGWPRTVTSRTELAEISGQVEDALVIKAISRSRHSHLLSSNSTRRSRRNNKSYHALTLFDEQGSFRVLDPNSLLINVADMLGFFFLLSDMVLSPYVIAWKLKITGIMAVMMVLSSSFWTIDLVLCFFTGVHVNGELELNVLKVARLYLFSWFPMDFTLCAVDWISLSIQFLSGSNSSMPVLTSRLLAGCRMIRAGRLLKLTQKMHMMTCWEQSDTRRLLVKCVEVIFCTFLMAHLITCIWFNMGTDWIEDSGETWLHASARLLDPDFSYWQASPLDQYLTALHWTVAQLTTGSSEIMPANSLERAFTIALMILGLLFGSSVVSLFSAQIVQVMMSRLAKATTLDKMRQYLQQHGVSHSLSVQVMSQTVERLREKEVIRTEDVAILPCLSKTLRYKLIYEICLPHLVAHPLFESWTAMDSESVLQLCREAVASDFISSHMEVFLPGMAAKYAYYIKLGSLAYDQPNEYTFGDEVIHVDVQPDMWLSEAALWSQWKHLGYLTAETLCQVMTINADAMWKVLRDHIEVASATAEYCKNFHLRIQNAAPPHAPWPNDVTVPFTDPRNLLANHIGIGLLMWGMNRGLLNLSSAQVEKLKSELQDEKCALDLDKDGVFTRVVYVEAIRVDNGQGQSLIQVGTWEREKAKASCCYPAKKRARRELPQEVLTRILDKDLKAINGHVHFEGQEEEVEETRSAKYGVTTKYHRTVHMGKLQVDASKLQMHKMTLKSEEDVPECIRSFVPKEVLFLPDCGKNSIYAWLDRDSFEVLRSTCYTDLVDAWLEAVTCPLIQNSDI